MPPPPRAETVDRLTDACVVLPETRQGHASRGCQTSRCVRGWRTKKGCTEGNRLLYSLDSCLASSSGWPTSGRTELLRKNAAATFPTHGR